MPRTLPTSSLALASLAIATLCAGSARADLAACGDIHVEAMATCEVVPPGADCKGMCTPLSVRAACAAELEAECGSGGCKNLPSVDCKGTCSAACGARCDKLEPGKFDCEGDCKADCSGSCAGRCETYENAAKCEASCTASCDADCQGSCDVELPEADCDAGCEASCDGSCDVDANFDCQVDCQSNGFADCEAEIEGGCDIACEGKEGALFCDGQYVDHGDNLQECIDALKAALNVTVETHAEASCSGNRCQASASAKIGSGGFCAVSAAGDHGGAGLAAPAVFTACLLLVTRARVRRRRTRGDDARG